MTIYNPNIKPYDVILKTLNSKHIPAHGMMEQKNDQTVPDFAYFLNVVLGNVNNLQLEAEKMQIAMVTQPETVDPHQVAIATTKAELALNFTNAITTRIINGFKDLQNMMR